MTGPAKKVCRFTQMAREAIERASAEAEGYGVRNDPSLPPVHFVRLGDGPLAVMVPETWL